LILVLATENKDKGEELQAMLREGISVEIKTLADYPGVRLPEEAGASYQEIAAAKAVCAARATGCWALGDDSGLEVDALGGMPGIYSARFAGARVTAADNRKKLLDLLGDLPDEKRMARFVCALALANPEGVTQTVTRHCEGVIARHESGGGGFGYDPVFWVTACGKTFAQMSSAEKNAVSHRGQAVRAALALLQNGVCRSC